MSTGLTIFLIVYVSGCVASYGLLIQQFLEKEKRCLGKAEVIVSVITALGSWVAFILCAGTGDIKLAFNHCPKKFQN